MNSESCSKHSLVLSDKIIAESVMSYSDNYYNDQTFRGYNDQSFRGYNDQRYAATSGYGSGGYGGHGACLPLPSLCQLLGVAGLVAVVAAAAVAISMLLMGKKKRRRRSTDDHDAVVDTIQVFVIRGEIMMS